MLDAKQTSGSILAVVVLYGVCAQHSETYRTLLAANANRPGEDADVAILLYDNTPGGTVGDDLPQCVRYYAPGTNLGIASAYNYALRIARQESCGWLLTLDQDTNLPPDFLLRMRAIVQRLRDVNDVGAIVPHLVTAGRVLSPVRIRPWGVSYLPLDAAGFAKGEIHALNSGSLFRVSSLQQIGGFDERFWLDYQDASLYRRLNQCAKRVYIADGLNVEHDLSLISEHQIAPDRFRNFLLAESAYYDMYRGWVGRLFLTGRLLGRIWRQHLKAADPEIQKLTRNALKWRMFHARNSRIEGWCNEMQQLMPPPGSLTGIRQFSEDRPAVSVCMAAYNGERYITAQLQSILNQLSAEDEVVVVDDASTDGTRNSIRSLEDDRIRLIEHSINLGVSRTFEDAIRGASGRILFLSDQDDIWDSQKIEKIVEAFRSHPDVTLVASDAALIDSEGSLIAPSYFAKYGKFRSGLWANLIRNRFGGCTMAFRAELIPDILPLPHRRDVLHDIWIGVRNAVSGHRTFYLDEPLVLNRRHSTTATGRKPVTLQRRLRTRVDLLLALVEYWIKGKRGFAGL